MLTEQGYEYLKIHTEAELLKNLRVRLSVLNKYDFSDSEWERFLKESVANPNEHIVEKTRKIQEDHVQVLRRDDGTSKNILLIDKKNVHNNFLQVINQYAISQDAGAKHDNRYDVTVLVNGLPLVHIELKRRGVAIREAFNQINRYQRDSFWAGCGLFEYVQIFVISNGTNTKYYSNSTRINHINENKTGVGNYIAASFGLPRSFVDLVVEHPERKLCQINSGELAHIAAMLTSCSFSVSGTGGWNDAMVTAGGVALDQIDMKTMGVKRFDGLYVIGEALNADGMTGGYNLQMCWSTASVCADCLRESIAGC